MWFQAVGGSFSNQSHSTAYLNSRMGNISAQSNIKYVLMRQPDEAASVCEPAVCC